MAAATVKTATLLVILAFIAPSSSDIHDNEVGEGFVEAAAELMGQAQGADLANSIASFMKSDGAKHLGSMMFGNKAGGVAGDIMEGIGNMMSQGGQGGQGMDMNMVANIMNLVQLQQADKAKPATEKPEGFDFSSAIALANSFIAQDGSNDMLSFLPPILDIMNSFYGPEADKIKHEHSGHAWFLPPVIEKLHVLFDIFMNSKTGRQMVNKVVGEKFIKVFAEKDGRFSFKKFVDLLENHSFRKHWISMVTARVADLVAYMADPYTQQKFLKTTQFFINSVLKSQGVPEQQLFDPSRATRSIVGIVNFFSQKFINMPIDSTFYIQPVVEYVQEIFRLAENHGILGRAVDSRELTHKLTDTINLEVIEPIARVNRALRFATKIPTCTKYVLCTANEMKTEKLSLPGLKRSLSNVVTLGACWYLSGHDHMDFWTLYESVVRGENCKHYYSEKCNDFHIEEIRVSTEYIHPEL